MKWKNCLGHNLQFVLYFALWFFFLNKIENDNCNSLQLKSKKENAFHSNIYGKHFVANGCSYFIVCWQWVADGSPTHSTAVRIENPLQFVPPGTNPKEFKKLQQLVSRKIVSVDNHKFDKNFSSFFQFKIKDNRRADKISAGPQSHILEGVTWDEASRIKDANVSGASDHVVLMGAASKGIIQRGYQHNATVYKAPYAKNPFDSVTDDELNDYKKTIERKRHGDCEYICRHSIQMSMLNFVVNFIPDTDTDFSESEGLSSLQISAPAKLGIRQSDQSGS